MSYTNVSEFHKQILVNNRGHERTKKEKLTSRVTSLEVFLNSSDVLSSSVSLKTKPGLVSSPGKTLAAIETKVMI